LVDDAAEDLLTGVHHLARDGVGLENMDAMLAEDGRDGGLAASEAAGEAYTQHASPIRARREMRRGISDDCKACERTETVGETYFDCEALFASVPVQQGMDESPGEGDSDEHSEEDESEHQAPGRPIVVGRRSRFFLGIGHGS